MSCDARGRCRFCFRKHIIFVSGSDEATHMLLQESNVKLAILNTVCLSCITKIEDLFKNFHDLRLPFEKIIAKKVHIKNTREEFIDGDSSMSISNLEISGTPPIDESIQIQSRSDIDPAVFQRNARTGEIARIDIGNKSNINSTISAQHGARVDLDTSQVCENIVRTKKKQRPLTCDFCRKEFNHTGDFKKHRRTHTGEQPYTCNICQQRFSHVSNLIRHQRIHSGMKPFFCQSCGRNFARKDKLTVHLTANRCNAKVVKEKSSISQSGII